MIFGWNKLIKIVNSKSYCDNLSIMIRQMMENIAWHVWPIKFLSQRKSIAMDSLQDQQFWKLLWRFIKIFGRGFSQEDCCLKSSISASSKEHFGILTRYIIQESRQKWRLRVDQTILDGRCSRFLYMHNICE